MNPYQDNENTYQEAFKNTYLPDEDYDTFTLTLDDDTLDKMLVQELDRDVDYWNRKPWQLQKTDSENVAFLLDGDYEKPQMFKKPDEIEYKNNRLFSSTRATLSYAFGQLAIPELVPSRGDDQYVKMARSMQSALYQHSLDEHADQKFRAAGFNLLVRKRAFLKLRYDPNAGVYGDVVTEVCNPEDIIIDRFAGYMQNPNKIYHRVRCSVDELCSKFPNMAAQIRNAYQIKQGRYSQMSRYVTYFECWFTYFDSKHLPREGVCWFIPEHHLILDKMKNPNWVYTGNDKKDKQRNLMPCPPKPFVSFNYLNLGHSYIDETCLFEQAKPMQILLNRRLQQIWENADYVNGRWIASKNAFNEEDGYKLINKGPKTVALVAAEDARTALVNVASAELPAYVYNTMLDARNEIDIAYGTPSIFKGDQPHNQDTLGRDMMVKQQAGMLQDDLVRAVSVAAEDYYSIKLQMMSVYYTDDYWFQVKGGDGKFDFVMMNGDNIDTNVKVGVQVDSTLPLDKASIRATAMELAKKSPVGIDMLTLMEDLGLPDPDVRTERYLRSQIDAYTYMQSVEQGMDNNDAEVDIMLLTANKIPEERDAYDEDYINYFNHFITMNRFAKLPQDAKQRLISFLQAITQRAEQSAQLQESMLNDAGIINRPPIFPLPKRTLNIRLNGMMDPNTTQQIAGSEGQMFTPVTQAQQAQDPNQQALQGSPTI